MHLFLGSGAMFDSAGHDDEFTLVDYFDAFSELHLEGAPDDEKELVLLVVLVPDEFALELGQPDVLAVELADHPRIPVIREPRELFADVDLLHLKTPETLCSLRGIHLLPRRYHLMATKGIPKNRMFKAFRNVIV